jgi:hypothetical protein
MEREVVLGVSLTTLYLGKEENETWENGECKGKENCPLKVHWNEPTIEWKTGEKSFKFIDVHGRRMTTQKPSEI